MLVTPTPKLQFLLYFREHCVYPNSNSRTYLSTSTNKAQCETKYISSAIVVPTAIFTGHSCNHFFGNNNKAASFERSNKPKCTTPFMRPQRLPLCWIWEFVSHDFPQFITGGQGLWTQFFVLHIAYTTMYIPTSQRNVPEQTLISQTLLVHMVSSNQDKWKNVLVLGTAYKKQDCCFWTKNVKRCSSK